MVHAAGAVICPPGSDQCRQPSTTTARKFTVNPSKLVALMFCICGAITVSAPDGPLGTNTSSLLDLTGTRKREAAHSFDERRHVVLGCGCTKTYGNSRSALILLCGIFTPQASDYEA